MYDEVATDIFRLNYTIFETKEKFIDSELLRMRNSIAHGEFTKIDENFDTLADTVLTMLDQYKTEIENAASSNAYRKNLP